MKTLAVVIANILLLISLSVVYIDTNPFLSHISIRDRRLAVKNQLTDQDTTDIAKEKSKGDTIDDGVILKVGPRKAHAAQVLNSNHAITQSEVAYIVGEERCSHYPNTEDGATCLGFAYSFVRKMQSTNPLSPDDSPPKDVQYGRYAMIVRFLLTPLIYIALFSSIISVAAAISINYSLMTLFAQIAGLTSLGAFIILLLERLVVAKTAWKYMDRLAASEALLDDGPAELTNYAVVDKPPALKSSYMEIVQLILLAVTAITYLGVGWTKNTPRWASFSDNFATPPQSPRPVDEQNTF